MNPITLENIVTRVHGVDDPVVSNFKRTGTRIQRKHSNSGVTVAVKDVAVFRIQSTDIDIEADVLIVWDSRWVQRIKRQVRTNTETITLNVEPWLNVVHKLIGGNVRPERVRNVQINL